MPCPARPVPTPSPGADQGTRGQAWSPGKPQGRACLRPCCLFCPIPRPSVRLKRVKEFSGDGRYLLNSSTERGFICPRRLIEAANLAHELQRRRKNFCLGHGWFEIEEGLDISTHTLCS